MSYMEIETEAEEQYPGLGASIAKVEQALMEYLTIVNPELQGIDWMPSAWAAGIEAIGYNREGRKFRAFDLMYPFGQSVAATIGVVDVTRDGYLAAVADGTIDDED